MKAILSRIDSSYIYAFFGEATLALTFVFYIVLARVLGPEEYGVFAAAVALGSTLSFLIQFGLPILLGKEVAANPIEGAKNTSQFLLLEILISLGVLLILFPIAQAIGFTGQGIAVCYLVVLSEVCRSIKQTLRAVLRSLGDFRSETISVSLERLFVFLFSGAALLISENLIWVLGIFVAIRTLDIIVLYIYTNRKIKLHSQVNYTRLLKILKKAYPFAISAVLWILYYQIDLLMLKRLAPVEEVGFYSAAYRLIEIFSSLPRVIFFVVFPKFARSYVQNPKQLPQEVYRSLYLLLGVVLPVITIAGCGQTILVDKIYGSAFLPSIASLAILLPSLGIKMFGTLVESLMQATGKEKMLAILLLITVIFNIVVNGILIPIFGAVGAAIATLLSEVILALVGAILVFKIGYQAIGKKVFAIAILSLVVAAVPSLVIAGVGLVWGLILMLSSLGLIIFLILPNKLKFNS